MQFDTQSPEPVVWESGSRLSSSLTAAFLKKTKNADVFGGTPSPVLDLRRASDRRFPRVFGNPGPPFPRKSAWKGLYAHSGGR